MSKFDYKGVGVALITPFNADGSVDYPALSTLIDTVIADGADYIVTLGTTAETPAIVQHERESIAQYVKSAVAGRVPLVIGIGGNCTKEVVDAIHSFDLNGFEAVLSVAPYYNKPSQQGIYLHYKAISEASPLPVILYNVPSRTGVNIKAETTLRIAGLPGVIGIKEASGDMAQIREVLAHKPDDFFVVSGDDMLTLDIMEAGGIGVISVAANVFTVPFCRMVNSLRQGDKAAAHAVYDRLAPSMKMLFEEGNPTGVKTALVAKGIIKPYLRLPLIIGSDELLSRFKAVLSEMK